MGTKNPSAEVGEGRRGDEPGLNPRVGRVRGGACPGCACDHGPRRGSRPSSASVGRPACWDSRLTPRLSRVLARGHARLVALGVGQHPEPRGVLVADQDPAGLERRPRSALGDLGRHPDVEVEALPRLLVQVRSAGTTASAASRRGRAAPRRMCGWSVSPSTARQNGLIPRGPRCRARSRPRTWRSGRPRRRDRRRRR